jgi:hypothetical protein
MVTKDDVTIYVTEEELCKYFRLKRVVTAKWIGVKGNRKMVIHGIVR